MLTQVYGELVKSLHSFSRHKVFALVVFIPPLFLSFLFINAFTYSGDQGFPVVVVNEGQSEKWSNTFVNVLSSREGTVPYFDAVVTTEKEAEELFNSRETFMIVYIPEEFSYTVENNLPVHIKAKINTIHEDVSKNLRLGLESRIYQFITKYQLDSDVRPGFLVEPETDYETELLRSRYMITGVLVMAAVFVSLFYGAVLGVEEKNNKTITEIIMSPYGEVYARIGKVVATILISWCIMVIFAFLCTVLYGSFLSFNTDSVVAFGALVCLTAIFSIFGVLYGFKVGDFRAVPAPTIIVSFSLWLISGSINPLGFSASSDIFAITPTAAVVRILTAAFFHRGVEHWCTSWAVLGSWVVIAGVIFLGLLGISTKK